MMRKGQSADPFSLASPRHGHFRLESGHHANLWLDLEGLFVQPARLRPFVNGLARTLRPHKVAGVCGPLVGGAFLAQLQGHGAEPVVIGALLVLGSAASPYFAERGVPIVAVTRVPFDLWVPAECPLCASGQALADP